MKAIWALAVLGIIFCPSAARADMGFPGFKTRELRVVIDNLGDFPDYDFFLVLPDWVSQSKDEHWRPDRPLRLVPGEPFDPGYPARFMHDWVLIALPRKNEGRSSPTWEMLKRGAPGVLHSNQLELSQPGLVSILSPKDFEVRHFHLTLTGTKFVVTLGTVEYGSDGFGSWVPGIMVSLAVLGTGLWIVRRLCRRRAPKNEETKRRTLPGVGGPVRVGDCGTTESALYLTGAVRVGGARRTARSDRGPVEMGIEVVVVGDDPIGLIVRPIEPGREGQRLPNHGQLVYATQQEREDAVEKRDQIASQQDRTTRRRGGSLTSAAFGAVAAGLTLSAVWLKPSGSLAAAVLTIGALWGFCLYRLVYWVVGVFGTAYRNLATISTNIGLVGTAAGFTLGTWESGVWGGVIWGTVLTVVLTAAIPTIVIRLSGGTSDV